jgi:hypothetical protein
MIFSALARTRGWSIRSRCGGDRGNRGGWEFMDEKSHPLQSGDYTAILDIGDKKLTQRIHALVLDPETPVSNEDLDSE